MIKLARALPGLRRIMVTLLSSALSDGEPRLHPLPPHVHLLLIRHGVFRTSFSSTLRLSASTRTRLPTGRATIPSTTRISSSASTRCRKCDTTSRTSRIPSSTRLSSSREENWQEVYFDAFEAMGGTNGDLSFLAPTYFILLYLTGNLVILSLFVSIIISNHVDSSDGEEFKTDIMDDVVKDRPIRRFILRYRKRAPAFLKPLLVRKKTFMRGYDDDDSIHGRASDGFSSAESSPEPQRSRFDQREKSVGFAPSPTDKPSKLRNGGNAARSPQGVPWSRSLKRQVQVRPLLRSLLVLATAANMLHRMPGSSSAPCGPIQRPRSCSATDEGA